MFQPIIETILGPIFAQLSRWVGEPIPAYPWTTLSSVFAALALSIRVVDESSWGSVGLAAGAWRARALCLGLLVGAAAIGSTFLLLWATGARVEPSVLRDSVGLRPWAATAGRITLLLAPAALWEELVFRGYLWTVAEDAGGVTLARWTTALAFGVVHLLNPGAGFLSTLLVTIAGFGLGAVRQASGSIVAAWLAHLTWNWLMAAVLHVPVSGVSFDTPGYRMVMQGPEWWTGGAWGPEGGAAAFLVMTGALLLNIRGDAWRHFRARSGSK